MGYRAEKNKIESKIRLIRIIALCVALVIVLGLCVFSVFVPPKTWKYYVAKPSVAERGDGELRIHFIDVGQGDSALIELPDGKVALIDGGDTSDQASKAVLRYLNALDIDVIDYLFVTHSDADHCGGLTAVLQYKTVLNAYLPFVNPEYTTATYLQFYQEVLAEECEIVYTSREMLLQDKEKTYQLSCLYPYSLDTDSNMLNGEEPECSILWLEYKGVGALFMADATMAREGELLRDDELNMLPVGVDLTRTKILKVGHHGSKYSTASALLEYCNIEVAVISCGKGNPYGHPTEETLERLRDAEVTTFRTDRDGAVMITINSTDGFGVNLIK
ncbi:MAG: MBL fold metallo-hydrolase [Clostridiales bacterium]|nr:MBL fold metallo-hydrolase [Clostridiales bacterium]